DGEVTAEVCPEDGEVTAEVCPEDGEVAAQVCPEDGEVTAEVCPEEGEVAAQVCPEDGEVTAEVCPEDGEVTAEVCPEEGEVAAQVCPEDGEVAAEVCPEDGEVTAEVCPEEGEVTAEDRRNYTDKELINDMIVPLLHQWTKANALFKPPVINQCRTIELKLTKLWHKAVETSLGKGNVARKNEFLHTLDTPFDILTYKCSIQLCSESNCSHSGKRENNSHIDCGCPREKKIPVLELEFIKAQRTKAEGQGSMQMGSIDYSETKKQIANAKKREQIREREQKKKMKIEEAIQREEELCQDVYHFFDIPPINVNATKLSELVDLSLEVLEPPLTTSLTSQELRNLKETPMQVPKWLSHTQSVERCVKMVTEAAGHVYSHERQE
ncbi:hypothetical protein Hamer_G030663, partial [Homarus americanus]